MEQTTLGGGCMKPGTTETLADAFGRHRPTLWAIAYRLTGSIADADDVVQDTFVRALERPPVHLSDDSWRPWLVRVAVNLGRDHLRRRRRRPYVGSWLPSPLTTGGRVPGRAPEPVAKSSDQPAARYDVLESVSLAFLLALEALTPSQRAILLLCDVFEYSVREAAVLLEMTESNVKTTHHRARRALRSYDRTRRPPTPARQGETREALERFLACLSEGDTHGLEVMLSAGVRTLTDAGGAFKAALRPVVGPANVARLYIARAVRMGPPSDKQIVMLNGLPAAVLGWSPEVPGRAPRVVLQCMLDERGLIQELFTVLAPPKLTTLEELPQ